MNEIETILYYKEIIKIINNLNLFMYLNNISNKIIDKIKGNLNEEALNELSKLNEENIKIRLNNINLYEIFPLYIYGNKYNNKLYYYKNTQIINKKIFDLLYLIDTNIISKIIKIKCIFDNGNIIMHLNEEIINVGYLNEYNEFCVKYLMQSDSYNNSFVLIKIFNNIKKEGYKYIESYLSSSKLKYKNQDFSIKAKIFELLEGDKINIIFNINDKLKTLILLSIIQQKLKNNNFCFKEDEKIFLINRIWLINNQYNEINSLIGQKMKLKKIFIKLIFQIYLMI